jgi:hypothetical protein
MNTRKILLAIFVIFLFTSTSLFAVDFSFGVKGGVNLATFGGEDTFIYGMDSTMKFGFSAGVFGSVILSDMVSIQPSVLFTLKGTAFELWGLTGYEYYHYYYIEIPILVKFYPPMHMFHSALLTSDVKPNVFAGSYLGINLFAKYFDTGEVRELSESLGFAPEGDVEDVATLDYGLVFGVGVDYKQFLTELSFSLGLASVDASELEIDWKNFVITLMVGYRIL